jgi:hypothetical protein
MKTALTTENGIVHNLIVLEEGSTFEVPSWLFLEEVNDWIQIGDHKDTPEPQPIEQEEILV